jgi:hypothetical protein
MLFVMKVHRDYWLLVPVVLVISSVVLWVIGFMRS